MNNDISQLPIPKVLQKRKFGERLEIIGFLKHSNLIHTGIFCQDLTEQALRDVGHDLEAEKIRLLGRQVDGEIVEIALGLIGGEHPNRGLILTGIVVIATFIPSPLQQGAEMVPIV